MQVRAQVGQGDDLHFRRRQSEVGKGYRGPGALPQPDRLRGDADGVADAFGQQDADAHGALDAAGPAGPGLAHSHVQGVVGLIRQEAVGVHGGGDGGGLDGYLDGSRPYFSSHSTSRRALSTRASAVGPPCFSRTGRESDPAFTPTRMGMPAAITAAATSLTRSLVADVARVDAQAVHARPHRGQGQVVIEVDVGDQGQAGSGQERGQRRRRFVVRHGHPHDVAARGAQVLDLGQGRRRVAGVGIGHGLYAYRRPAAHGHRSYLDTPGTFLSMSMDRPPLRDVDGVEDVQPQGQQEEDAEKRQHRHGDGIELAQIDLLAADLLDQQYHQVTPSGRQRQQVDQGQEEQDESEKV